MLTRLPRRRGVLAASVLAIAAAIPAGLVAVVSFSDVPLDNPYYTDIQAMAATGVTTGCGNGKFCPKDFVTREQMAAFMNRLGALSAGKTPVANADRLDGLHAADFLAASGPTIVSIGGGWRPFWQNDPTVFTSYSDQTHVKRTGGGANWIGVSPSLPVAQSGRVMQLDAVEICYDATDAVLISMLLIAEEHANGPAGFNELIRDTTDRTDTACRRWNLPEPYALGPTVAIQVFMEWTWATSETVATIGRTTLFLSATDTAVPASDAVVTKASGGSGPLPVAP